MGCSAAGSATGRGTRSCLPRRPTAGWMVSVDSTTSRAHQHAARARKDRHLQKEPPGGVHDQPADHALGRSCGDLTIRHHLRVALSGS